MKKLVAKFKRLASKRKRFVIFAALFFITTIFFGQQAIFKSKNRPQQQTAKVERGTIVSTVSGSGQILTTNAIEVKTQATGQVVKVYVGDGDQVSIGQKIAEITPDRLGQQKNAAAYSSYLSAQNTLAAAQAKMNSLQSALFKANQAFINDKGINNPTDEQKTDPKYIEENAEWLAAEADYKNQAGVIAQTQTALNSVWLSYQLSSPVISAPIAGIIGDVNIAPGMVISTSADATTSQTPSQKIAVIRSEGTPIAMFNISEIDVTKIKKDQKTTITLDSLPGKTFTGKVIGIDKTGVVSSGVTNYPATVQFDTQAPEILPNMAASTNIIVETKSDVLLIPSAALQTQGGQTFARVLRNGKEMQVPLEVGIASDSETEIISGLSEGDEVITGTVAQGTTSRSGFSPFGTTSFGGGGLRPGGFGGGGGQRR